MPAEDNSFRSLLNFRDPGGIAVGGDRRIRKGVLFRSANPDRIGRKDLSRLLDYGIRTIADLRAESEVSPKRKTIDKTERLVLALDFQQRTREMLKPVIRGRNSREKIADISNDLYLEILDAAGPAFREVLEVLSDNKRLPLLIHCQAGKDRTGIFIALIMKLLGADNEQITAEFLRSNDALLPSFRKHFLIRSILTLGYFPYNNLVFAVTVKRRNIESVLNRIDNHYGGIEGYVKYSGFNPSLISNIREKLLEENGLSK